MLLVTLLGDRLVSLSLPDDGFGIPSEAKCCGLVLLLIDLRVLVPSPVELMLRILSRSVLKLYNLTINEKD